MNTKLFYSCSLANKIPPRSPRPVLCKITRPRSKRSTFFLFFLFCFVNDENVDRSYNNVCCSRVFRKWGECWWTCGVHSSGRISVYTLLTIRISSCTVCYYDYDVRSFFLKWLIIIITVFYFFIIFFFFFLTPKDVVASFWFRGVVNNSRRSVHS